MFLEVVYRIEVVDLLLKFVILSLRLGGLLFGLRSFGLFHFEQFNYNERYKIN